MNENPEGPALNAQNVIDDLVADFGAETAAWKKDRAIMRETIRQLTKERDEALKNARTARVAQDGVAPDDEVMK